jgi:hypothetical protein
MCLLAICNLEFIKKLSLKFKKHLCYCAKDDEAKKKLDELYKMEDQIDTDMHKLQDEIHKLKNEFYKYRKTYKGIVL